MATLEVEVEDDGKSQAFLGFDFLPFGHQSYNHLL